LFDTIDVIKIYFISILKALCGVLVDIPTLTAEKIPLNLANEIVKPTTAKRIPGYGLPYPKVTIFHLLYFIIIVLSLFSLSPSKRKREKNSTKINFYNLSKSYNSLYVHR
jgi:hypothetical protein